MSVVAQSLKAGIIVGPVDLKIPEPQWLFLLCLFVVVVLAVDRFRSAVVPSVFTDKVRRARAMTTPLKYFTILFAYAGFNIVLFSLLCSFPDQLNALFALVGLGDKSAGAAPVAVAVVLYVLFYSDNAKLKAVDNVVRGVLYRFGSMPRALMLFLERMDGSTVRITGRNLARLREWYEERFGSVSGTPLGDPPALGLGGPTLALGMGTLEDRWLRVCHLCMLMSRWRSSASVFHRFYMANQEAVEDLLGAMRGLQDQVAAALPSFFAASAGAGPGAPPRHDLLAVSGALRDLLRRQHTALGCALFSKWWTGGAREHCLRSMGFFRNGTRTVMPVSLFIRSVYGDLVNLALIIVFFCYPLGVLVPRLLGYDRGASWTDLFLKWPAMVVGVAVACSLPPLLLATRREVQRRILRELGESRDDAPGSVARLVGYPLLCLLFGWAVGVLVLGAVDLAPWSGTSASVLAERFRVWGPWGLYCACMSLGLWILFRRGRRYFGRTDVSHLRRRWLGLLPGLYLGLGMLLATWGSLAVRQYVELGSVREALAVCCDPDRALFVLGLGLFTGLGVGLVVPRSYWNLFDRDVNLAV